MGTASFRLHIKLPQPLARRPIGFSRHLIADFRGQPRQLSADTVAMTCNFPTRMQLLAGIRSGNPSHILRDTVSLAVAVENITGVQDWIERNARAQTQQPA